MANNDTSSMDMLRPAKLWMAARAWTWQDPYATPACKGCGWDRTNPDALNCDSCMFSTQAK